MTCQWIIRGLVIALLCLCISGWVISYLPGTDVGFWCSYDGAGLSVLIKHPDGGGKIYLRGSSSDASLFGYPPSPKTWLGFGFRKAGSYWLATIPFWLPTTFAAVLLWLTWRMTRTKSVGQGFPVDITENIA